MPYNCVRADGGDESVGIGLDPQPVDRVVKNSIIGRDATGINAMVPPISEGAPQAKPRSNPTSSDS